MHPLRQRGRRMAASRHFDQVGSGARPEASPPARRSEKHALQAVPAGRVRLSPLLSRPGCDPQAQPSLLPPLQMRNRMLRAYVAFVGGRDPPLERILLICKENLVRVLSRPCRACPPARWRGMDSFCTETTGGDPPPKQLNLFPTPRRSRFTERLASRWWAPPRWCTARMHGLRCAWTCNAMCGQAGVSGGPARRLAPWAVSQKRGGGEDGERKARNAKLGTPSAQRRDQIRSGSRQKPRPSRLCARRDTTFDRAAEHEEYYVVITPSISLWRGGRVADQGVMASRPGQRAVALLLLLLVAAVLGAPSTSYDVDSRV